MPEIKNTFTQGKMNKDLDERLVPQGEYRDALNIQVRTTDGGSDSSGIGDAGTVQNIKGNNDLKPETVTSSEFGLELSMLNNRLNLDVSVYDITTEDLIFDIHMNKMMCRNAT